MSIEHYRARRIMADLRLRLRRCGNEKYGYAVRSNESKKAAEDGRF
jgi:hypothetical protein